MSLGRSGGPLGSAMIVPMKPQIGSDGRPYIPLYYQFPFGGGVSVTECSALVKPFWKLLEDGKPIGKIAFLFYRENESYFILGSFAFTDRTIFFPGLTFSRVIHAPDGRDLSLNEKANNIAHLILGGILALLVYLQFKDIIDVNIKLDKIQSSAEALINMALANANAIFSNDNDLSSVESNLGIPVSVSVTAGFVLGITRRG